MTKETVTLIAAAIAAGCSLLVLVINLFAQWRGELRATYRRSIEKTLAELGEALHQVVACSNVLTRTKPTEARETWKNRASEAKTKLKEIRSAVRYPLWGLDEGIRVLTRLPDWIMHKIDKPDEARKLLAAGDRLRASLDFAIRRCYADGRPPSLLEKALVAFQTWRVRKAFSNTNAMIDEDSNGNT